MLATVSGMCVSPYIKGAGITIKDVLDANWTAHECYQVAFTLDDYAESGFNLNECKSLGLKIKGILKAGFKLKSPLYAGWTAEACTTDGFDPNSFEKIDLWTQVGCSGGEMDSRHAVTLLDEGWSPEHIKGEDAESGFLCCLICGGEGICGRCHNGESSFTELCETCSGTGRCFHCDGKRFTLVKAGSL